MAGFGAQKMMALGRVGPREDRESEAARLVVVVAVVETRWSSKAMGGK